MALQLVPRSNVYNHNRRPSLSDTRTLQSKLESITSSIRYHSRTVWLFTFSDLKTTVGPSTAFAILHKLGSRAYQEEASTVDWNPLHLLAVIAWIWINLLPFTIDNQRGARSIIEDSHNKSWRPIAAGRITPRQATILMYILYPIALLTSISLGAFTQSFILVILGVLYNDLGGADGLWIIRNFLNACGYLTFSAGSLQVILGQSVSNNPILVGWFAILGAIILSTVHIIDLPDQEGDARIGRKTVPLIIGDKATRWALLFPLLFWSWAGPRFWGLSVAGYVVPLLLGGLIAMRTLKYDTVSKDKATSKLWHLWLVAFYCLPILKTFS